MVCVSCDTAAAHGLRLIITIWFSSIIMLSHCTVTAEHRCAGLSSKRQKSLCTMATSAAMRWQVRVLLLVESKPTSAL